VTAVTMGIHKALKELKESKERIKKLETAMRKEAAVMLKARNYMEDEGQAESLRLSACRLIDAVKYK